MTHIEDAVLLGGVDGTRQAINALRNMRDMLGGQKAGSVSVKWDGAPTIFAGTDPSDGKFFVAKKGILKKKPEVYKTIEDIEADSRMSGDLSSKFKDALKYLPELGIKGIIQGDFLFSRKGLKKETIENVKYVTFHPNTLLYAIPIEQAQPLLKSKVGIVWHTSFSGTSLENIKPSFGADVSSMKKTKNVWSQDAMLRDVTSVTLDAKTTDLINKKLSLAGSMFRNISTDMLREIETNRELSQQIQFFNNTYTKRGIEIKDTAKHVDRLVVWIEDKYKKDMLALKSQSGKDKKAIKLQGILDFFSTKNRLRLKRIFDLQKVLVSIKMILISKLNELGSHKTFIKTSKGYKTVGAEGFVAIDHIDGGALKLVDRLEFSYNNFSPNVIKGWVK
tara:strand:+ start:6500 stop:7672 length:1173 start_codon:yes stop_codon:yes gene_type:complete